MVWKVSVGDRRGGLERVEKSVEAVCAESDEVHHACLDFPSIQRLRSGPARLLERLDVHKDLFVFSGSLSIECRLPLIDWNGEAVLTSSA